MWKVKGTPIPTVGMTFEDRDKLAMALHTGRRITSRITMVQEEFLIEELLCLSRNYYGSRETTMDREADSDIWDNLRGPRQARPGPPHWCLPPTSSQSGITYPFLDA